MSYTIIKNHSCPWLMPGVDEWLDNRGSRDIGVLRTVHHASPSYAAASACVWSADRRAASASLSCAGAAGAPPAAGAAAGAGACLCFGGCCFELCFLPSFGGFGGCGCLDGGGFASAGLTRRQSNRGPSLVRARSSFERRESSMAMESGPCRCMSGCLTKR